MAVLIDEYGGFSGIVTMQDLVEEVMGNIEDEHDSNLQQIEKIDDFNYIVDALFSVDEFEERFGINIKIDETKNYNTISGYIIDILGVIPDNSYIGKEIETEKIIFKIISIKEKRIEKLKITIKQAV